MPCGDITVAIEWAKRTTDKLKFPVRAYFTKHSGVAKEVTKNSAEFCWYGVGEVHFVASILPHLEGELTLYMNNGPNEAMRQPPGASVWVEIFDAGTISYQLRRNGKPVGGLPPITVFGTCVQDALATGTQQNEVVTVGVHRLPAVEILKID